MKVHNGLIFQNTDDYLASLRGDPPPYGSSRFYQEEMRLGELGVSIGFDGVWTVEHHFSGHGETPNPLQQLTFFAGRCPSADVGTFVLVLPWNDPVRLAEQVAILDNLMSPEQTLTIGLGRGAAAMEFEGFEVPLSESTARFRENWEIMNLLLTQENVTFEGQFRSVKNLTTYPRPRSSDLSERFYMAWGSMQSMEYAAAAGFRPLFTPKDKPAEYAKQMEKYNKIRHENGYEPLRPIVGLLIHANEDGEAAEREALKYLRPWAEVQIEHYHLLDADHFKAAGNYAEYAKNAEAAAQKPYDELVDSFATAQIYGTPEQCLERIREAYELCNPEEMLFVMRYGGMPYDVAERNIRLIAEEILPEVKSWQQRPVDSVHVPAGVAGEGEAGFSFG